MNSLVLVCSALDLSLLPAKACLTQISSLFDVIIIVNVNAPRRCSHYIVVESSKRWGISISRKSNLNMIEMFDANPGRITGKGFRKYSVV